MLLLALGAIVAAWQAVRATSAERSALASAAVARNREHEADLARGQAEQRRDELARLNEDLRRTHYTKDLNLARVAWDENNVSRTRELLEKHRPRPGEPDLRGFEWYYLDRLAQGGELKIDAHAGGVNAESVAFLPDGRRLISSGLTQPLASNPASQGCPGAVSLWDAATGRPLPLELDGPSDKVAGAALSPDGTRLAASIGDHTILLWDLATGGLVTLEGPADTSPPVCASAPTASGWFPSTALARVTLTRFDESLGASSRKLYHDLLGATHSRRSILQPGWSTARRLPRSCGLARCVRCGDGSRGILPKKTPNWIPGTAVFSPDGTRLAACADQGIRIWDVTRREPVAFWPTEFCRGHLAFSQDGKHLARAGSGGLRRSGTRRQVERSRPSRDTPETSTRSYSARTARACSPGVLTAP